MKVIRKNGKLLMMSADEEQNIDTETQYYEEGVFKGIMFQRDTPEGYWHQCFARHMTTLVLDLREQIQQLEICESTSFHKKSEDE